MKKLISIPVFTLLVAFSANAQIKTEVKQDAKKVEHKTEEVASKTKSKIVDKTYKDKVGPDGQTIYIDKHAKYYWVDKKGRKQYVTEAELKDKM